MSAKDIKNQIKSIKNTQKITRAMEMVAASKMRKAQDRMAASRPYSIRVREVVAHLADASADVVHPYMEDRDEKAIGCFIVSSDRGLCGGLNNNLIKLVTQELAIKQQNGIEAELCIVGKKAESFFVRHHANIVASVSDIGDNPSMQSLVGIIKVLLDSYLEKNIDAIYIAYNEFASTMLQKPRFIKLLPVVDFETSPTEQDREFSWDYIYEPSSSFLLDHLLRRYIDSLIYQAVVENAACEQAARMVAMKSASDNAGDLIEEFQLIYNKARQAAITKELAEIVAGAAAV